MPTILSHAAVPLALALGSGAISKRLFFAGVIACILPDIDVLAFRLNIAYSHDFGHRGFTHSVVFSFVLALLALVCSRQLRSSPMITFLFIGLSALSHPLLDMITTGGLGVTLWWPWSSERYFAAWQVIEVSPLSLSRVFSARGFTVLQSELLWIWLPAIVITATLFLIRTLQHKNAR